MGLRSWLELQYEEEIVHATKIYRYLIEQAVPVRLAQIGEPPSEFGTMLEVFEASFGARAGDDVASPTS